jgi:hypothetical protein
MGAANIARLLAAGCDIEALSPVVNNVTNPFKFGAAGISFDTGGKIFRSSTNAITAFAGGGQTSATALTSDFNRVTTVATSGDSVKLPASVAGLEIFVANAGAAPMDVFPFLGDTIAPAAVNIAYRLAAGTSMLFVCTIAGTWVLVIPNSASNALTAFAGGGQGSATILPSTVNRVSTVATIGDSVKLPLAAPGSVIFVSNTGVAAMDVFPTTGDQIAPLAANTAYRINTGVSLFFQCTVAAIWTPMLALPKSAKYTKNTTVGGTTAAVGDLTGAAVVSCEYSAVGAANMQVRTATQMFNDAGNVLPGDSYLLIITNTSAGTTTITTNTGITLTGTMTLALSTTRTFLVTFTTATACVIQSIGVGTIS